MGLCPWTGFGITTVQSTFAATGGRMKFLLTPVRTTLLWQMSSSRTCTILFTRSVDFPCHKALFERLNGLPKVLVLLSRPPVTSGSSQ